MEKKYKVYRVFGRYEGISCPVFVKAESPREALEKAEAELPGIEAQNVMEETDAIII